MRYEIKDNTRTKNVLLMTPDDFAYLFGMAENGFHHDCGFMLQNNWFPIETVRRGGHNAFYAQFAVVIKSVKNEVSII